MKAMIFAAGLGTRLRPLTDTMPKALVPVAGKPMLEHVIMKLKSSGFDDVIVNIHHFGEQITDFLRSNDNFGINIRISDERAMLLDTGGGIKHALELFPTSEPLLVHNVDILCDVNLKELYEFHLRSGNDATLLVSRRKTSRYLLFDKGNNLCGWINRNSGETKPAGFVYDSNTHSEYAFSGIHVVSPTVTKYMGDEWNGKFPIMGFYLRTCHEARFGACIKPDIRLIDIGKPETLEKAEKAIAGTRCICSDTCQ